MEDTHSHAWETKVLWALVVGDASDRIHRVRMYDDPVAKVHSMEEEVEALENGGELATADDARVAVEAGDDSDGGSADGDRADDDPEDGGREDYGIACDAGCSRAETRADGVGATPNHVLVEAHGNDRPDDFGCNLHDLDDHCRVRAADDCTESGGTDRVYASRDTEVAHRPKSWANSVQNASVGGPENEEKGGFGDNSIGSQAPVSVVRLGSCSVCCACFCWLLPTRQKDWISHVDALSSPGHFWPVHQDNVKEVNK